MHLEPTSCDRERELGLQLAGDDAEKGIDVWATSGSGFYLMGMSPLLCRARACISLAVARKIESGSWRVMLVVSDTGHVGYCWSARFDRERQRQ